MALVLLDRVQQTGTANTTVSFTLSGTVVGFQSFTNIGNGNTTFYEATDASGSWETGLGTYSTTGPTLTRTVILQSSNTGSAVTFVGTVNVFVTYPSSKSVNLDASGNVNALGTVSSGTWQGSTVGVAYGGTGVIASTGVNSVVLRDANANITFNNYTANASIVTAAAGTTVLTAASGRNQILTGSTTQTYQLPNATTLSLGQSFVFVNNSSGVLTVKDSASTTVESIPSGGVTQLGALSIATSAGTWGPYSFIPAAVDWGTNALNLATTVISGGTWQGGTIASGYGGTGLTTFAAANNALYSTSAGALAAGTLPVAAGGTGLITLTAGYIPFGAGASAYGSSANLFWDSTNSLLGVGTAAPAQKLHLAGGTTNFVRVDDTTNSCYNLWGAGSGNGLAGTYSNHPLLLVTNSIARARIDTSGNVGIGKTPVVLLDVAGNIRGTSSTTASNATITPTSDTTNQYTVTALAAAATIAVPTGSPIDGQKLTIRIKDNGTARALTWTVSAGGYRIVGTTLPATTVISKVLYVGCIYNSQDSFWDVVAIAQQA